MFYSEFLNSSNIFLNDWYIDGEGFELNCQSALKGEHLSNTEIFTDQVNQGKIKIPELC